MFDIGDTMINQWQRVSGTLLRDWTREPFPVSCSSFKSITKQKMQEINHNAADDVVDNTKSKGFPIERNWLLTWTPTVHSLTSISTLAADASTLPGISASTFSSSPRETLQLTSNDSAVSTAQTNDPTSIAIGTTTSTASTCPYIGGRYHIWLRFPPGYPKAPQLHFGTPIYHPRIDTHGTIRLAG
jgi:hypothetical protein